jgi:excisionase family DNA binding protein
MTSSPWLTVGEAAERARTGASELHRALAADELRGYQRKTGGKWRIHVEDLDAWVRGEIADVRVPSITRGRAS